ncbi:MAG: apolipoprotein N-acyltransferase [Bacteroidetes bacterium]|nr:apolipoprotein N-acyltransferase [Bacteroidota bacterium]MBU1483385.1 apolipoprotein N-acyltransferase [Bacteroidota bacterium]MBU2046231.1 apolipoprotein N-acyltransferase [Bacteroidota bacterium]MBU2266866.1 apolipoprotein N-acyltransferase [Bacteroidota bacterium]MBU2376731.1 apolipoprotein N-acyltransferase [Bacteroidota bacterium]
MKRYIWLALFSAFLLWFAWPPISFTSPILLIAFLPLLIALQEMEESEIPKKGRKVFLIAGLTFLVWNTASIYWVFNSLNAVMPTFIAALLSLIPFGLGAFLMTLSFWLYRKVAKRTRPLIADISLIGFWISYEYLHQSWDLKFPWMTLGNGFATTPQLIQWYEYTGVYGGTFWVLVSNLLLFRLWMSLRSEKLKVESKKTQSKALLIAFTTWVIVPIGLSILVYSTFEEEINPANVVVVQPNIDPYGKNFVLSPREQTEKLIKLSKDKGQVNTEFFIWPETALVGNHEENNFRIAPDYKAVEAMLDSFKNATVITGAETYQTYDHQKTLSARFSKENNFWWDSFNTAVAIDNSSKIQFYHKSKLVPGVEKMPFPKVLSILNPLFEKFGGTTGGYGSQDEPSNLYASSGIGVVPAICYESIWGEWVAKSVNKGAQFIAIITNDGWWGNTSGKDQHLDYARLRAIENRRWVARSANTGISAFINERGDIVQKTEWWKEAVIKQDINLNTEITFYTANQDWIVYPFLLIGGIGILFLVFIRFKKRGTA